MYCTLPSFDGISTQPGYGGGGGRPLLNGTVPEESLFEPFWFEFELLFLLEPLLLFLLLPDEVGFGAELDCLLLLFELSLSDDFPLS